MRIRLDEGARVVLLAAVIALLIAINGLFDAGLTREIKKELSAVAREYIPLSILTATMAALQQEQVDIFEQTLAPAETLTNPVALDRLRNSFLNTGSRLRETREMGEEIARAMEEPGKPTAVRAKGSWALAGFARVSVRHDEYERRALALLGAASDEDEVAYQTRTNEVRALGADLQAATGTLKDEADDFAENSADAVVRHAGTDLMITLGFALLAYLAGVFMLLQIRRIIKAKRDAEAQLTIMATYDPLSGLFNRRHFMNQLEVAVAAAHRYEHPLSLCICDLDEFKQVNDTYGHGSGDEVIRQFGNLVREEIRAGDFAGRYGGDEFCIVLNHTPALTAGALLERIRSRMENLVFQDEKGTYFQASATLGVADMDPSQPSPRVLIEMADLALYEAKRQGRNCIVTRDATEASGGRLPS